MRWPIRTEIGERSNGGTLELRGTFDWTEANAAASWALGSDGAANTGDEYAITVPATTGLTITAAALADATIQGPGNLPAVDLEGFPTFISSSGGGFANLTISNLVIFDFDLAIGMFFGSGGSTTAFNGTSVTNNRIRTLSDERGSFSLPAGEPFQNIGIHFSIRRQSKLLEQSLRVAAACDAPVAENSEASESGS